MDWKTFAAKLLEDLAGRGTAVNDLRGSLTLANVATDWKAFSKKLLEDLAEKDTANNDLRHSLTKAVEEKARLQFRVIEQEEQLVKARADGDAIHRVKGLERELQTSRAAHNDSINKAKDAERKLQAAKERFILTERELQARNKSLQHEREDQARTKPNSTLRANEPNNAKFSKQIKNLKAELARIQNDRDRVRAFADGLQRQLHAEKAWNASWEGYKSRDKDDDESSVPMTNPSSGCVARSHQTFRPPPSLSVPQQRTLPTFRKPICRTPELTLSTSAPRHTINQVPLLKRLIQPSIQSLPGKRTRSEQEELDDEVRDLRLDRSQLPRSSKRRKRHTDLSEPEDLNFEFQAILSYSASGGVDQCFTHMDLIGSVEQLWERIHTRQDKWEAMHGQYWEYELTKTATRCRLEQCVTRKLQSARTRWRLGGEGMFACRNCVLANRPCFTFKEGEFLLLPLHRLDRRVKVKEGREIRHWINDKEEEKDEEEDDEGAKEFILAKTE